MIVLNAEWSELMRGYEADHSDARNQACHKVGTALVFGCIPASVISLPVAAAMLLIGTIFLFVGHHFEGNKPSVVNDRRSLIVGLLWWLRESGVRIQVTEAD
jgi:uncharacterized membrane protein YGL010W